MKENTISSESINLKKVCHVLFKRKKMILIFFTASVLVAIGISYLFSPVYITKAKIFVRIGRETSNIPASVIRTEIMNADPVRTQINNEIKLLSSKSLIAKVVEKQGIEQYIREPETVSEKIINSCIRFLRMMMEMIGFLYPLDQKEQIILKLQKNLQIVAENDSRMISVYFFSKIPGQGEKFLNALLPVYLEAHLKAYSYDNELKLFYEEMSKARAEWNKAERELESFKKKWHITAPDAEQKLLMSRIGKLETALKTAGHIKATDLNKQDINSLNTLSKAAGNPVLATLAMKIIDLEMQRDAMEGQYKPSYKPYRNLVEKIARLKRRLQEEISNSSASTEKMLLELKERLRLISQKVNKIEEMKLQNELKRKQYEFLRDKYEEAAMLQAMNKAKITNVTITDPPFTEPVPVSPKRLRNIALGMAFGLLGGIWSALFYEYLRQTVSFPEDMESRGIPVLASFPALKNPTDRMDFSSSCEALYFSLRPSVRRFNKIFLSFAASRHGEGATTVASAFADYLSNNTAHTVLLVDVNLRGQGLSNLHDLSGKMGLKDFILKGTKLSESVVKCKNANFSIMPAGRDIAKPGAVLEADSFNDKMKELEHQFDIVIFDLPPVALYPDFISVCDIADIFVLVVEAETTKLQIINYAANRINKASDVLSGAVINKRRRFIPPIIYKYI